MRELPDDPSKQVRRSDPALEGVVMQYHMSKGHIIGSRLKDVENLVDSGAGSHPNDLTIQL
ncbi:MAG: hypothetical protein QCI82_00670 [Candidatus Thermoplasmatota archaeon]|nr:hypothetical protein [Candidatus Thermoplasmatota archaeon]